MDTKKIIVSVTVMMGLSVLLFQVLMNIVSATQFNKENIFSTSYPSVPTESIRETNNSLSDGFKNFILEEIDRGYFRASPTNLDMTKIEAAELGAQALWEVFGISLENQVVNVGYVPGSELLPRPSWFGNVLINENIEYYFQLDSVTGELLSVGQMRTLDQEMSLNFDRDLNVNPQEYIELAKRLAGQLNVVSSPLKTAEYVGHADQNNDPTISIEVVGVSGEHVTMTFSRYDQVLLSITKIPLEIRQ